MSLWNITWSRLNLPCFSVVFVILSTSSCKKAHTPNPSCPIPIFLPAFFVCSNLSASPQSSPQVQLQAHVGWSSPQLLGPKKAWRERDETYLLIPTFKPQKDSWNVWGPIIFVLILLVQCNSFIFLPIGWHTKISYIIYSMYKQIYTHIITYTIRMK